MKYNIFRYQLSQGSISWDNDSFMAVVLAGYSFNEAHQTLADINLSGGATVCTGQLSQRVVSTTGWAVSAPVVLPVVPQGGPYDLVLVQIGGSTPQDCTPLVFYDNALTPATNGDVVMYPEDAGDTGRWFRF